MPGDDKVKSCVHDQLKVGQRVSLLHAENGPKNAEIKGSKLGTVKFIGSVDGFQGTWVGVDWDSGEGLHHGDVDGVHYFDTSGEKSGSFVRPHFLSTGVTLLDALTSKYQASSMGNVPEEEMYLVSTGKNRKTKVPVLLVGKEQVEARQGQLGILRLAALPYAGVRCAGPNGQIQAATPNIVELDLTGHLLPNWHEVKRICDELPALHILDLSCSRLTFDADLNAPPVMSNLTGVALNNCGLTWSQVEVLKNYLPNIQDLSLIGNNISRFKEGDKETGVFVEGFETLRLLNLDDNCIEEWQEVMKLSKLPGLAQLSLNGNQLTGIKYPEIPQNGKSSTSMPFASLRCLYLGRNDIDDWQSVDALDRFPTLQDVRLSDNPLTDQKTGTATRYMLIARIDNLTCLNGSAVKPRERRDSEIRYVRHVLTSMRTNTKEETMKRHPRFEKLRLMHDLPEDIWSGCINTTLDNCNLYQSFASNFASVTINCVAAGVGERMPVTKKLPLSTTIGKLKGVCEALFRLHPDQQRLYFKDQDSPQPIALEDDAETLADAGIGPGRIIVLDEIECHLKLAFPT